MIKTYSHRKRSQDNRNVPDKLVGYCLATNPDVYIRIPRRAIGIALGLLESSHPLMPESEIPAGHDYVLKDPFFMKTLVYYKTRRIGFGPAQDLAILAVSKEVIRRDKMALDDLSITDRYMELIKTYLCSKRKPYVE